MRSTKMTLASSTPFTGNTAAFSTSATNLGMNSTSATFFGYSGGFIPVPYGIGIALQGNFAASSTNSLGVYGGTLNLMGSNVPESPMFVMAASALISTTGSVIIRDSNPWYQYVDFKFIPNSSMASSAGTVSVYLSVKGNT